ncbi:hypothetical protein ACIA30_02670 [Lactobacillus delbrueckii subsp. bulgaricus]|uniref:hypothetical protein n=1 Tax=Lactobacillus delbrueckii TaxID=1584 RepID=UPI003853FA83
MTALTENEIKFYEDNGFNRWTKFGYDRLYFDMETILDVDRYKTGNISHAELNGEEISHRWAGELLAAKVWIEVSDGSLHVKAGSKDQRTEVGKVVQDYLDSVAKTAEETTEETTEETAKDVKDAEVATFVYIKEPGKDYAEAWPFADAYAAESLVTIKRYFPIDREELTKGQLDAKYPDIKVVDMTAEVRKADQVLEEACRWMYTTDEWLASDEDLDKAVSGDEDDRLWAAHFGRPQDLDKLVHDPDRDVRAAVAECQRPQDLDVLVHDDEALVRMAVAGTVRSRAHIVARPQDLDVLVHDPEKRVRMAVADQGRDQDLDILAHDKSRDVRERVLHHGRPQDLALLRDDEDRFVRTAVAKYGSFLDAVALTDDQDRLVSKTAWESLTDLQDHGETFFVTHSAEGKAVEYASVKEALADLHKEERNFCEREIMTGVQFWAEYSKPADAYASEEEAAEDGYAWDDQHDRWIDIDVISPEELAVYDAE